MKECPYHMASPMTAFGSAHYGQASFAQKSEIAGYDLDALPSAFVPFPPALRPSPLAIGGVLLPCKIYDEALHHNNLRTSKYRTYITG